MVESDTLVVTPPAPPARNWRTPKPVLSFGEKLIADIDPEGGILDADQRATILRIENEEALKTMLYADLSDPKPDISTAHRIFGDVLMREIKIPEILMTWQFYAIIQCQNCIEMMTEQMKDKTLSGLERVNAGKARLEAIKALNHLLTNARSIAKAVGIMVKKRDRSKPVKIPKNVAPTLGG